MKDIQCGDIFLVKNDTFISRIIRWITRSEYSHCGVFLDSMHIYHTEYNQGLRITHSLYPKGKVEVYRANIPFDNEKLHSFICDNIGNKYDFGEILKVLFRINKKETDSEYICSSLVREAFLYASGVDVCDGIEIPTPKDIANSRYLTRI